MRRLSLVPWGGVVLACLWLIPAAQAQMLPVVSPVSSPAVPLEGGGGQTGVVAPLGNPVDALDVTQPRDPFWPVGYVPKRIPKIKKQGLGKPSTFVETTPEPVRAPLWEEARKKLDIRGISLIHDKNSTLLKYLAMVAGKLVETGDVVAVRYDERVYRWRVVGISEEGVSLQKMDVRGD